MNRHLCWVTVLMSTFAVPGCTEVEKRLTTVEQRLESQNVAMEKITQRLDTLAAEQLRLTRQQETQSSELRSLGQEDAKMGQSLTRLNRELESGLNSEALKRTEEDKNVMLAVNQTTHAVTTRVGQLEMNIDQLSEEMRARSEVLVENMTDLRTLLTRMPLDYSGLIYVAGSNIVDKVARVANQYVPSEIRGKAPTIIVLDAANANGDYCKLGYDLSQQIAAILGAQRLTTSPIRTQDDVEQKITKKIAGEADAIYNEENLRAIGIDPEVLFYLEGRIEDSDSGYRVFYHLHRQKTDELFPVTATGETMKRTADVTAKYDEKHLTPVQKKMQQDGTAGQGGR